MQPPLFVLVSVSVTEPAAVSAALGLYVALSVFALGEKVPLPLLVHVPLPVLDEPLSAAAALFAHTVTSLPASTIGGCVKVTIIVSCSGRQLPLLVVVRNSVTVPAVVSAVLGTYVALSVFAFGENVPLPDVLQVPVPVLLEPFSETFGLLMHTAVFAPAFGTGAGVMVTIN